jgi:hypothetical protein
MKRLDHLHIISITLFLQNFKNKNFLIHVQHNSSGGCTTHHSPGMKRKIKDKRLILRPFPEHSILQLLSSKAGSQRCYVWVIYDLCCLSYSLVQYMHTQNSYLTTFGDHLVTAYAGIKERDCYYEDATCYSLSVVDTCTLLNRTYHNYNFAISTKTPTYKFLKI